MTLKSKNLGVYVVSHKVHETGMFDDIIKIEKENDFSRIVE